MMDETVVEMNKLDVTVTMREPRNRETIEMNKLNVTVALEED